MRNSNVLVLSLIVCGLAVGACKKKQTGGINPTPTPSASPSPSATATPAGFAGCPTTPAPKLIKLLPRYFGNKLDGTVTLDVTPKIQDETSTYCRIVWPETPSRWGKSCAMGPEDYHGMLCQIQTVGISQNNGLPGPTWRMLSGTGTVRGTPNNPYLAWVTPPGGEVEACGNVPDSLGEVVCGSVVITPDMFHPPE